MEKLRVLLVDDEEEFVTTLAERLQLREIDTVIATDGDDALRMIKTDRPSVVVLDVMMPGIGGLDVLQQIRRNYPHIQVILLTGHATFKSAIEGMQLGAFDYLMKPCDLEELLVKVEEAKTKRLRHMARIEKSLGQ